MILLVFSSLPTVWHFNSAENVRYLHGDLAYQISQLKDQFRWLSGFFLPQILQGFNSDIFFGY